MEDLQREEVKKMHGLMSHAIQKRISCIRDRTLSLREELCRHRIGPVRKYLENHKNDLLEFVPLMEKRLENIAKEFEISLESVPTF
jgi:hypothetical protein